MREIDEYYANFRVTNDLIELRNLVLTADLIVRCAQKTSGKPGPAFQPRLSGDSRTWLATPYCETTSNKLPAQPGAQDPPVLGWQRVRQDQQRVQAPRVRQFNQYHDQPGQNGGLSGYPCVKPSSTIPQPLNCAIGLQDQLAY
jgi:hypothetical protein